MLSRLALCLTLIAVVAASLPAQQGNLTITTNSPLPAATVSMVYSQTLQATGGTQPLVWSVVGGALPPGLVLGAGTGTISGNPTSPGTFSFLIQVADNASQSARKNFTVTVDPVSLTIVTDPVLPAARVGANFAMQLAAAGGSPPYVNWRVTQGLLPQGINLNGGTGALQGTPQTFGNFDFVIAVSDSAFTTVSQAFSLRVDPAALTIVTPSPLPLGIMGSPYQQTLTAAGGPAPYTWEALDPLPSGLTLDAGSGALAGSLDGVGIFQFGVRVTDSTGVEASRQFEVTVVDPRATIAVDGSPGPNQQTPVTLTMATPNPVAIAGQITVAFAPDAINMADDEAILFSNGARTAQFAVPAGAVEASFGDGPLSLVNGTTAGTLTVSVTAMQTGPQAIPPDDAALFQISIPQAPPVISDLSVGGRSATGFTLTITGFSTPRQVSGASFRFTAAPGRTLQNSQVTVDLNGPAESWYQDPESASTGGSFVYTQPFTIQGDLAAIGSVSVTLVNSSGDSAAVTASF